MKMKCKMKENLLLHCLLDVVHKKTIIAQCCFRSVGMVLQGFGILVFSVPERSSRGKASQTKPSDGVVSWEGKALPLINAGRGVISEVSKSL